MKTAQHLTSLDPGFDLQVRSSYPGQAHFAGTGPARATCGQCVHWVQKRKNPRAQARKTQKPDQNNSCAEFLRLTGKHGPAVPRHALACRYFKPMP